MRAKLVLLAPVVLLVLGCGAPGAEESAEIADEMRAEVVETIRTVSDGLVARGIVVASAGGSYSSCGLTTPQLQYGGSVRTTLESGTVTEQIEAARAVIEDLGLPMVEDADVEDWVSTDGAEAPLRVSASEARADRGTIIVEVVRDCEELDRDVMDDRLSEDSETLAQQ